jgi:hypothetical protein
MGILESDLVKLGVDILTKFLEVINKATSALDGIGGSITKIGAILSIFKVGKSLFAKIPESFKMAMISVIREAIDGGKEAGEGAVRAARDAAIQESNKPEGAPVVQPQGD